MKLSITLLFPVLLICTSTVPFGQRHHVHSHQNPGSDHSTKQFQHDHPQLDSLKQKYNWISQGASFEQSSKGYWDQFANHDKLLDGSGYDQHTDYDYAFHTRTSDHGQVFDRNPFIIIDLKYQAKVNAIYIHNRIKSTVQGVKGLTVWISDDKAHWTMANKSEEWFHFWVVNVQKEGRYIKLGFENEREHAFHLRSVAVFGNFLPGPIVGDWYSVSNGDSMVRIDRS